LREGAPSEVARGGASTSAAPPARAAALAVGLDEVDCEALLVLAPSSAEPDLAPFLAAPVHLGQALLVAPRDGAMRLAYLTSMERDEAAASGLALLAPERLEVLRLQQQAAGPVDFLAAWVAAALAAGGVPPGRVALAGHGPAGLVQAACAALAAQGWVWVEGGELVAALRKRKSAAEMAAIEQAAAGAVAALQAVARLLAAAAEQRGELWLEGVPLTVARLRAEVGKVLGERSLEQPRGNILAPAEEGGVPHSAGSPERVLRAREPLVVDVFPRGSMFADCTRTFCAGAPPEALLRAHGAVVEALVQARAAALPGVRGWDLQEAVCATFERLGYATPISHPGTISGYVHNLGHGVGFELHEQPIFRKSCGAEGVLAIGDVFTLEPGLYDPEAGYGLRLEDLFHLAPSGLEVLTPLPHDLDPRSYGG
jgi:Xaa-Pro aminopeptidase